MGEMAKENTDKEKESESRKIGKRAGKKLGERGHEGSNLNTSTPTVLHTVNIKLKSFRIDMNWSSFSIYLPLPPSPPSPCFLWNPFPFALGGGGGT